MEVSCKMEIKPIPIMANHQLSEDGIKHLRETIAKFYTGCNHSEPIILKECAASIGYQFVTHEVSNRIAMRNAGIVRIH